MENKVINQERRYLTETFLLKHINYSLKNNERNNEKFMFHLLEYMK